MDSWMGGAWRDPLLSEEKCVKKMQKIAVAVASRLRWVPGWHSPAVGWRRRRGRGGRRPAAGQGRPGGGRGRRAGPDTWATGGIPGKKKPAPPNRHRQMPQKRGDVCSEGLLSTCCIWPCSQKETCLHKKIRHWCTWKAPDLVRSLIFRCAFATVGDLLIQNFFSAGVSFVSLQLIFCKPFSWKIKPTMPWQRSWQPLLQAMKTDWQTWNEPFACS